jgi:hypothetical protein
MLMLLVIGVNGAGLLECGWDPFVVCSLIETVLGASEKVLRRCERLFFDLL